MKPMGEVVKLKDYRTRQEFTKYYGYIFYSLNNIKLATEDLDKYNKKLNSGYQSNQNTANNLNELGRLDRVLKDYIILKIASLFDNDNRTLSLIQLKDFLVKEIPSIGKKYGNSLDFIKNKYENEITKILDCRHQVVAHAEKDKFNILIHTQELLEMPITELLDEISSLLSDLDILLSD